MIDFNKLFFNDNISYFDVLYYKQFLKNIKNEQLSFKINKYYLIPIDNFNDKIEFLYNLLINPDFENDLKNVKHHIIKKINYLKAIIELYQYEILLKNSKYIFNYELVYEYFKTQNIDAIELKNGVYWDRYSTKFAGNYFLEIIDPAHRELIMHKYEWEQLYSKKDFFAYLELYSNNKKEKIFKYFSNNELNNLLLYCNNNKLFNNKYGLINTDNDKFIFTIDLNKNIYGFFQKNNKYNHISSTKGKPILGAGIINIINGEIKELKIITGHYLINKDKVLNIINIFIQNNYVFDKNTKIYYFDNNILYNTLYNDFISNTL